MGLFNQVLKELNEKESKGYVAVISYASAEQLRELGRWSWVKERGVIPFMVWDLKDCAVESKINTRCKTAQMAGRQVSLYWIFTFE
jgi:hypothetical protein